MRNRLAFVLLDFAVRLLRAHHVTVDFGGAHATLDLRESVGAYGTVWTPFALTPQTSTSTTAGHVHWGS